MFNKTENQIKSNYLLNRKKVYWIIGIVAVLLVLLIAGAAVAAALLRPKKLADVKQDYYQELRNKCHNNGCCLTSVKAMSDGNYKLEPEGGCPERFARNMLKCAQSYKWCESVKNAEASSTAATSTDADVNIADWQTYRNKEIGIEFQYPKKFGNPQVAKVDNTSNNKQNIFSGKKITVSFPHTYLTFLASTADFKDFNDYDPFTGNDNIKKNCANELKYGKFGDVCKDISLHNIKAVFENKFYNIECSPTLTTRACINNANGNIYKGLTFALFLKDINRKISDNFNCADINSENNYKIPREESENVIEKKNLSEQDLGDLNDFEAIIKSFKFINKSDTSDWQTYKNEQHGFEFKLPGYYSEEKLDFENMGDKEYTAIGLSYLSETERADFKNHHIAMIMEGGSFSGTFYIKHYNKKELEKMISKNISQLPVFVNENRVKYYIYERYFIVNDQAADENFIVFETWPEKERADKFNREIFSTFSFVQKKDISGWQTYKNEDYGFEFKYPDKWRTNIQSFKGGYYFITIKELDSKTTDFEQQPISISFNISPYNSDFARKLNNNININGVQANKNKVDSEAGSEITIDLPVPQKFVIDISGFYPYSKEQYFSSVFDLIMNTIKF